MNILCKSILELMKAFEVYHYIDTFNLEIILITPHIWYKYLFK